MPTLDWIGKKAVVNHHRQVPFHLLKKREDLSCGDPNSGNLLVQADNLLALKALLPYYAGQVKCIYIDPPYNTGNEGWIYNDNVNSPEMKAWLGKAVGKEAEDLTRHDKWLCMMYPRLQLLRDFLREDGVILISIDDNEVHSLRFICDEIFGSGNFVANILWQKRTSPDARIHLGPAHDHILVYRKSSSVVFNKLSISSTLKDSYKNPDDDPRGAWTSADFTAQGWRPNQMYKIVTPAGKSYDPPPGRCWANIESEFERLKLENRLWFGKKGDSRPRVKNFLSETEGVSSWTWWPNAEVGHNQEAKKEINAILESGNPFDTPKPLRLIQRILELATAKDSLILDSFAGSGTTGHAVFAQNKLDNGSRRFILVEMDSKICNDITATRLKKAVTGYGETVGLGGGFSYCELGSPLFDETGQIKSEVTFHDLARHVFFTETGNPLPEKAEKNFPLLGIVNGIAVYLLYNGVLKDKRPDSGNILTVPVLHSLAPHDGPKVIYGVGCRIGATRLAQEGITFHQIPYAIKVS
jgi:site-specific DNA-methyltransferase (adenine-specific)/adenine-specific DNA-methyltransferase